MWEYRWAESPVTDSATLTALGREGWEAVGVVTTGVHFGETYVRVLLKRLAPATVDLTAAEQRSDAAR